jgi:hypothetical protein
MLRTIERTHRDARNLFVTADELSRGVLAAKPIVRQRVFERAAIESKRLNPRELVPVTALTRAVDRRRHDMALVSTFALWRQPVERWHSGRVAVCTLDKPRVGRHSSHGVVDAAGLHGTSRDLVGRSPQIAAVEGTMAALSIDGSASRVVAEHEGAARPLTRAADGRSSIA